MIEHHRSDFWNYAADATSYNYGNIFLEVISDLETTIDNLFNSFFCNSFKVNPSKCHLVLSPFNLNPPKSINIKKCSIEGSCSGKFLGVSVGSSFAFDKHNNHLCKEGNNRVYVVIKYMPLLDVLNTWVLLKYALYLKLLEFLISIIALYLWMFHKKI